MGCPINCWIQKRHGNHPIMRYILSIFVSTTIMFLLKWYLHLLLVKKTSILSLMLTISFTVTNFPQVFLRLSYICPLKQRRCRIMFFAEVRVQKSAPRLRQCIGGTLGFRILFFSPKSGCRHLHVDLGFTIYVGFVEMDSWLFSAACISVGVEVYFQYFWISFLYEATNWLIKWMSSYHKLRVCNIFNFPLPCS